jgi:predicted PurR-regulated permease PerM
MSDSAQDAPPQLESSIGWPTVGLIVSVATVIFFLRYAAAVFIPVILAILVSYALDPAVTQLARWRIPRPLGAMFVVLGLVCGFCGTAYFLRDRFIAAVETLPDTARKVRTIVEQRLEQGDGSSALDSIKQAASEIEKTADATATAPRTKPGVTKIQIEPSRFRVSDYFLVGSRGLAEAVAQLTVILFLAFFLLASGDLYKRKLVRLVGSDFSKKRITVEALHEIDRQIERFLAVQIWVSVFVAIATWIGLAIIGVAHAGIWGAAAGVLNFIPYFGAVIATAGLGIVAFVQFGTITAGVEAGAIALCIRVIEGGLLAPILMGRAAGINGVALFVSLLFWGWLWGIIGTLLAVPTMMIVKTVCERIDGLQPFAELLSEK